MNPKQGTFSNVFYVKDKVDKDNIYIMKKISKANLIKHGILQDFRYTLHAQQRLNSSTVMKPYCYFEDNEFISVVLENANNGNLSLDLQKYGRLNEKEAFRYFFQTCLGLDYLHKNGITHYDLKPEYLLFNKHMNIVISNSGRSIKEILSRTALHKKFWYLAPEILKTQACDSRADMWSLGVILYELLHGVVPFQGKTYNQYYAAIARGNIKFGKISDEAKDLIQQLLRLDPAERLDLGSLFRHPWVAKHEQVINISGKDLIYQDKGFLKQQNNLDLEMDKENNQNLSNMVKSKDSQNALQDISNRNFELTSDDTVKKRLFQEKFAKSEFLTHLSQLKDKSPQYTLNLDQEECKSFENRVGVISSSKETQARTPSGSNSSPDYYANPGETLIRQQHTHKRYRTIRQKMPMLETSKEWTENHKQDKLRVILNDFEDSRSKKNFKPVSKLSHEQVVHVDEESMTFTERMFSKLFSAFNCCSRIKFDNTKNSDQNSEDGLSPLRPFRR